MCRGDVAPLTMRWAHSVPVPAANFSSPHTCYSWVLLNNWAKARSIENIFEPGYLKHPVLGDVYTWDGFELLSKIGSMNDSVN